MDPNVIYILRMNSNHATEKNVIALKWSEKKNSFFKKLWFKYQGIFLTLKGEKKQKMFL